MQKVKFWYDIKLNDDKTQQTVYKFYKKIYYQNLLNFGNFVANTIKNIILTKIMVYNQLKH